MTKKRQRSVIFFQLYNTKRIVNTNFNFSPRMDDQNIKRSRIKIIFQNISIVCGSLLLFFTIGEIVLRQFEYGDLVIYQADSKLFWKPAPNQNCYTKFNHKPVHINTKGTRGKDFDANKTKDVYRIISLGDSRTFGWGLSEPETYSGLLEEMLQKYVGDSLKIEVINAGVNAGSYAQIYTYLRDVAINYNPDIVILADANLWTQFSEESSMQFKHKFMRRVWLKNFLRRSAIYHYLIEVKLKKFYGKYRTKFIPVNPTRDEFFREYQRKEPDFIFKEQIAKICELVIKNHTKDLLIYIPDEDSLSSSQKQNILIIKEEVSGRFDIPLLDFTRDFSSSSLQLFLPGDPVHPNAVGNKIIANRIFHFVMTELDSIPMPAPQRPDCPFGL